MRLLYSLGAIAIISSWIGFIMESVFFLPVFVSHICFSASFFTYLIYFHLKSFQLFGPFKPSNNGQVIERNIT